MRLGNILAQQGGVPETGRPVRFQIRQKGKGGLTSRKWCDAVLLPLSDDERQTVIAEARTYCDANPQARYDDELLLRHLQRALRDPDNLACCWATLDELPKLRDALTADQLSWLHGQYLEHLRDEYPEVQPPEHKDQIRQEIERLQKRLKAMEEHALGESAPAPV